MAAEAAMSQAIAAELAISVILTIDTLHILCLNVCAMPVLRQLRRETTASGQIKRRRVIKRGGV
jgi:hypothetical protein